MTQPNDDLENKPVSDYFNQAVNALSSGQADRPKRDDDDEDEEDAGDVGEVAPSDDADPAAQAQPEAQAAGTPAPVMARAVVPKPAAAPRRMRPTVDPVLKALSVPRTLFPSLLCLGIASIVLGGLQYTLAPESALSAANNPRIPQLNWPLQATFFVIGGVLLVAALITMSFIRSRLKAAGRR